jgi:hypothetical protein
MVVLCDEMVQSGSTWSFNVDLELLRAGDPYRMRLASGGDHGSTRR